MVDRSVIIIGAGIGGLAAGCYARMSGYEVRIVEMHDRPGGLCTAWRRHGYTFDGCIHNLAGTSDDSLLGPMWRELGLAGRVRMRGYDELVGYDDGAGRRLVLYTDLDLLERHLKKIAPMDTREIERLIAAARRFRDFDLLGLMTARPWPRLKAFLRRLPDLVRWGGTTLDAQARRFKSPLLRKAFPTLIYDWPQQSMLMLLTFMGRAARGDLGWAYGGADAVAQALARRFAELGGEILYRHTAASVIVERDRAVGVALTDGTELRADHVVSNANGHATIYGLLAGRYVSRTVAAYYARPEDRIEMGVHVSLGVARRFPDEPHALVLELPEPVIAAGERRSRLYVEFFGFDPGFAPAGKTAVKVVLATSYDRWRNLVADHAAYAAEKQRTAEAVIAALDRRFPGLAAAVEAIDVATPVSTERFTGNGVGYRAAIMDMVLAIFAGSRRSATLPGLKGFRMVGQWAGIPGVPMVAAMGRETVAAICREDGRPFETSEAEPADGAASLATAA